MTDLDRGDENDVVDTPEDVEVPASSVWADLQREHDELAADRDALYLSIPGYEHLVAKYRYVPLREMKKSNNKLRQIKDLTDATVIASVDSILMACDELLVTHPDGEKPLGTSGTPLFDLPLLALADEGDPPIRFDDRLCLGMGWPTGQDAHQIVRNLFAKNERLILQHAQELAEWTNSTAREVRGDFVEG